jgi:LL-diaminopimelate aminotransferase
VVTTLRQIGLEVAVPKASLYVWAKLPPGWKSGAFSALLIEEKAIVVTPGAGYGRYGEGYIRLSLTIADEQLEKGLDRLVSWRIPDPPIS